MVRGRRQIPAFGNWNYSDEPITQRFESADGELVKYEEAAAAPVKPVACQKKVRKGGGEKGKKQRACEARVAAERMPRRAPKAVDEDLYKIPPELLCRKPKRWTQNWSLWRPCLGLNCVA
ncbi:uncharacterized protein LOC141842435 [Curcuma longa]|uniref:uncharacterized protein LOC141842435 n=1 Tax=Curcuma longa TaxID=136217 RepID=UPI003D9DD2D1